MESLIYWFRRQQFNIIRMILEEYADHVFMVYTHMKEIVRFFYSKGANLTEISVIVDGERRPNNETFRTPEEPVDA